MLLTEGPVLKAPKFDQACQLQVDASNVGTGAVLLQTSEDGINHAVVFFSRKFNTYQLNYLVIEKEALALIWDCNSSKCMWVRLRDLWWFLLITTLSFFFTPYRILTKG